MTLYRNGAYNGCYPADCLNVTSMWNVANTPDACIKACGISTAIYAGLYNAHICVCSEYNACYVHGKDAQCGVPCPGDQYKLCGGIEWMAVYKIAGTSVLQSTTDKGVAGTSVLQSTTDKGDNERDDPLHFFIKGAIFLSGALSACAIGFAVFLFKRHGCRGRYYPNGESYRHRMGPANSPSDPSTRPNNGSPNRPSTEMVQIRNAHVQNEPNPSQISSSGEIAGTSRSQSTVKTSSNYHGQSKDQVVNEQHCPSQYSNPDQIGTACPSTPKPSSKSVAKNKLPATDVNYPRMNKYFDQQPDRCTGGSGMNANGNTYNNLERACDENRSSENRQNSGRYSVLDLQCGNIDDSVYYKLERDSSPGGTFQHHGQVEGSIVGN